MRPLHTLLVVVRLAASLCSSPPPPWSTSQPFAAPNPGAAPFDALPFARTDEQLRAEQAEDEAAALRRELDAMRRACAKVLAKVDAARAPPPPLRTGVFVHGFHLQAEDRERAVWGDAARGARGRVPHGVALALAARAALVVLGSGGSADAATGELEGAHTLRELRERAARGELAAWGVDAPPDELRAFLSAASGVVRADTASRNTREELELARSLFRARGCERVVLVTSAAHAPRVARDASAVFGAAAPAWRPRELLVAPCDDDAGFGDAARVAVVEPPHRGDRDPALDPSPPLHECVERALALPAARRVGFARELDELLSRFEEEEEPAGLAEAESA